MIGVWSSNILLEWLHSVDIISILFHNCYFKGVIAVLVNTDILVILCVELICKYGILPNN